MEKIKWFFSDEDTDFDRGWILFMGIMGSIALCYLLYLGIRSTGFMTFLIVAAKVVGLIIAFVVSVITGWFLCSKIMGYLEFRKRQKRNAVWAAEREAERLFNEIRRRKLMEAHVPVAPYVPSQEGDKEDDL